jgi:hypothetical protein
MESNEHQKLVNAVSDGIAQNNTIGLVRLARLHFYACMALFSMVLVYGGIDGVKKTALLGIPVTLPGLIGFADIKKIRGEK